jgi:Mg-chelatase subunit ChlD
MSISDTELLDEANAEKRSLFARFRVPAALLVAVLLGLLAYCQTTADPRTLRELIVQSRDAYHAPWASVAEAATTLGDAQTVLAFVSQQIATSVYEGRLQTPDAALETRVANPADKAMLLQALLEELGVATQAVAAPLQGDARAEVLARALAMPIAMPEPMTALMDRVGYDADDLGADQMGDALEAALLLDDAQATVSAAMDHAQSLLDLDGPSSAGAVYLDWVWLEGEDGTIYDPILPDFDRSDLARSYAEEVSPTVIALSARDRFGRTREIVRWSGDAYGTDVDFAFYPTINTLERLIGEPDLSDVAVWTPGIVVGGDLTTLAAVTNDGDVVPPSIVASLSAEDADADITGFTAPQISDLSIASVDASTFPRVEVGISASVSNTPNWHGEHFNLEVEGQRVPMRIEEPFSTATEVIVVHDQTGSMGEADRFMMARAFGGTLIDGLSGSQRLAVIAHNDAIRVHRLFDPINNVASLDPAELLELPVRGTTSFLDALDYALNAIEIDLGESPELRTSIVLVTDGASSQADLNALSDQMGGQVNRAQQLNAAVYPIVLSVAETVDLASLAEETGGQLVRVQDPTRVESEARALARHLSGGMAISFVAPTDPVPAAGTQMAFSLDVEGFDDSRNGSLTVPTDIVATQPGIFVEITAGAHRAVRPLVALGDAYDVNAMTGQHSLFLAPGAYPSDRMTAQWLTQWLFAYDATVEDEEALLAHVQDPAFSTQHATVMNGLANVMRPSLPEGQALQYPVAALAHAVAQSADPSAERLAGERLDIATTLDVPAWSTFLSEVATRDEVARMGLALNDAEARVLGDGLNLTERFADSTPMAVDDESSPLVLAEAGETAHSWEYDWQTGSLFGYLHDGVLAAKGSRDTAIAAYFKSISSAIDGYMAVAQPAVNAMPTSSVLAGFIGFKKEEMKLWCYATIMLNYVNESIAGEEDAILDRSVPAAEARAAQLCEIEGDPSDVGERMFRAALTEMGKAVADQLKGQLPDGVQTAISPPDLPGWIAGQVDTTQFTNWIGNPTVREYANDLAGRGRTYLTERAREVAGRGFNEVTSALQRHGLGGGTGISGGTPTTVAFDAAMGRAIGSL